MHCNVILLILNSCVTDCAHVNDELSFIETSTDQIGQVVSELGVSLNFKVKISEGGDYYIEVRNKYDGTLVKTIPPEKLLDIRDKMHELLKGLIVNEET